MAASHSSVLTRKGQATIPVEFREKLGLQEGDQLIWTYANGSLTVTSAREIVRRTAGVFKDRVPTLPLGGIEQRIAEEKESATSGWVERSERSAVDHSQ